MRTAVYVRELWNSAGNGPRSFMPGVVAISGIVPAAIVTFALQHRFENPKGRGAHDLGLEGSGDIQPLKDAFEGLPRFNAVEDKQVCTKQSAVEFFNS